MKNQKNYNQNNQSGAKNKSNQNKTSDCGNKNCGKGASKNCNYSENE
ncbi:MAG: hypothetical protein IJ317_02910 [Clostridia bacterium]|nr:hypothetical protein [Clostridia bacterium]